MAGTAGSRRAMQAGRSVRSAFLGSFGIALLFLVAPAAFTDTTRPALLGLIIDDLGNGLRDGRRVIALPAPVACAILPHTAFGARLAEEAHARGKEVLLHLPMESLTDEFPGPGVLDSTMDEREIGYTLAYDLSTVPHASGVNNHMGSRLTQEPAAMRLVMQELRARGNLFFVDSKTSARSVAGQTAAEHGLQVLERSVFLDNEPTAEAVRGRLEEAIALARRHGVAVAIGHPYPQTLAVLEQWLAERRPVGVNVVPLAELLNRRTVYSVRAHSRLNSTSQGKPETAEH